MTQIREFSSIVAIIIYDKNNLTWVLGRWGEDKSPKAELKIGLCTIRVLWLCIKQSPVSTCCPLETLALIILSNTSSLFIYFFKLVFILRFEQVLYTLPKLCSHSLVWIWTGDMRHRRTSCATTSCMWNCGDYQVPSRDSMIRFEKLQNNLNHFKHLSWKATMFRKGVDP